MGKLIIFFIIFELLSIMIYISSLSSFIVLYYNQKNKKILEIKYSSQLSYDFLLIWQIISVIACCLFSCILANILFESTFLVLLFFGLLICIALLVIINVRDEIINSNIEEIIYEFRASIHIKFKSKIFTLIFSPFYYTRVYFIIAFVMVIMFFSID